MSKCYTETDLIRFIYGDMSKEESAIINNAIHSDFNLKEKYQSLMKVIESLNRISHFPGQASIDRIMEYSGRLQELETH